MSSITFLKDNVKDVITRINPGKDKVSGKFRLKASFLIIALLVLIIVTSVLCVSQRKILLKKSYDDIQMITAEKAGRLNEYFDYLDRLTDNFASDPATAEALSSLSETYANVEDELILTTGTFDVREIQNGLQLYYNAEILPALEQKSGLKFSFEDFHGSNSQSVLQYLYLAGNDRPAGQKHLLNKAQDNSSYSAVHGSWHPVVAGFAAKTGVSDVYLVDYKSGNIVYSYRKNIDYATNLHEGPFSNTALARAFTDIIADPSKGKVSYTDMSLYTAGMVEPLFFVASLVYDGEYLRGGAILAIKAAVFDGILKVGPG